MGKEVEGGSIVGGGEEPSRLNEANSSSLFPSRSSPSVFSLFESNSVRRAGRGPAPTKISILERRGDSGCESCERRRRTRYGLRRGGCRTYGLPPPISPIERVSSSFEDASWLLLSIFFGFYIFLFFFLPLFSFFPFFIR